MPWSARNLPENLWENTCARHQAWSRALHIVDSLLPCPWEYRSWLSPPAIFARRYASHRILRYWYARWLRPLPLHRKYSPRCPGCYPGLSRSGKNRLDAQNLRWLSVFYSRLRWIDHPGIPALYLSTVPSMKGLQQYETNYLKQTSRCCPATPARRGWPVGLDWGRQAGYWKIAGDGNMWRCWQRRTVWLHTMRWCVSWWYASSRTLLLAFYLYNNLNAEVLTFFLNDLSGKICRGNSSDSIIQKAQAV